MGLGSLLQQCVCVWVGATGKGQTDCCTSFLLRLQLDRQYTCVALACAEMLHLFSASRLPQQLLLKNLPAA